MAEMNKREQVKACIAKGGMTKAQIGTALGMSVASVGTNMTYLRWMDNYILTDADTKEVSFTDQETFEALEVERKANRKTKPTSTRTPEDRALATAKTIATQTDQLDKWSDKVVASQEMLDEHPDDKDAKLNFKEATAMVALLEVKLVRNEKLAEELPEVPEVEEEVAEVDEDKESTDELL